MEYCPGGELFDYIVKHQRVKEKEACRFFQQIIAGVEYIHKLGVVHRDLKPENLLLDHSKNIKLVDFGLSNTYQPGELLKTACGSPCYAAPEMIAGHKYVGIKVDMWSCGIILYALICGYLPFEDPNTNQLYKKILSGEFKTPEFLSLEAKDLLKGILNTDPEKRFSIDQVRRHRWFNQHKQEIHKGILVGYDEIPVDSYILSQVEHHGIDKENARKALEANAHDNATTSYYLLLKKHLKGGGSSVAEYRKSESCDSSMMNSYSPVKQNGNLNMTIGYLPYPPVAKLDISLLPKNKRNYRKREMVRKTESTGGSSSKDNDLFSNPKFNDKNILNPQLYYNLRNSALPSVRPIQKNSNPNTRSNSPETQQRVSGNPRHRRFQLIDTSKKPTRDSSTPIAPRPPSRATPSGTRHIRTRTTKIGTPSLNESMEYGAASMSVRYSPRTGSAVEKFSNSLKPEARITKMKELAIKC
jgi:5'-AMP-activated protein kinase catalytic alpha subunit